MFCLINNIDLINKNYLSTLSKKNYKFFVIKEIDYNTAKYNIKDNIVIKLDNINLEKINFFKDQLNIYKSKIERLKKLIDYKNFAKIKELLKTKTKMKEEPIFLKSLNFNKKIQINLKKKNKINKLTPSIDTRKYSSIYYKNNPDLILETNKKISLNRFKTLFK